MTTSWAWLDAVLMGLGLDAVRLCGHSYGGWLALTYTLHAPGRVTHLALLDPTLCFAGMCLSYRLHAVPLFLPGPRAARMRAFLRWETGGATLDPDWLALTALAAEVRRSKIVMPRRPAPQQLRNLDVPTLVLVAEKTRSHDPARAPPTHGRCCRRWSPTCCPAPRTTRSRSGRRPTSTTN